MKRCSLREWMPILPIPVWPLAWQCLLGQNTVAGSMICSFWLCVEACQEEYVGIPIFITSAFHHGSRQRYQPTSSWVNVDAGTSSPLPARYPEVHSCSGNQDQARTDTLSALASSFGEATT